MANSHSFSIDGTNDYAERSGTLANAGGLLPSTDFSVEAWVKISAAPASNTMDGIMQVWTGGGVQYRVYAFGYLNDGGTLKLGLAVGNGSATTLLKSASLNLGTTAWQYVAVTYDLSAGTAYFYHGDESTTPTQLGSAVTGGYTSLASTVGASFLIGLWDGSAGSASGSYLSGLADDLRFWSDLRTSTEIQDNYAPEALTGSEANLEGYWKANNAATDETSNANTLTLRNGLTYSTDYPVVAAAATFTPRIMMFV